MIQKITVAIVCFVLSGCFFSCTKKYEDPESESTIIGKWKLVESSSFSFGSGIKVYDYSQYNIVYEFFTNNNLSVSGIPNGISAGYKNGKHSYLILTEKSGIFNIMINDEGWCYKVTSNELVISLMPVDGEAYKFVKLK